ncbi:MAG: division/cell wall cluster transcriptional repressor MraZ [Spirochaetes bacterium GWD1_27_9]|nr:MAG: division/cell wall cluster transcriptional repressor MraZ [Spirochaetes bacterium GWB1_27_13]OHD42025.1 MAG: division/cell wall cluster transcriptional repressor MraZ [Spirochaetes bacterium GWD1_27_9]
METYFSGEFLNTLDEKGRIAFPAKLRNCLGGDIIWITKGMSGEKCLLVYSPAEWIKTVKDLESKLSIYNKDTRWLYRRFISPAVEVEIDKNGRIAIPQNLREHAGLQKECVFLGMNTVIELWDVQSFKAEEEKASESGFDIFEELSKSQNSSSVNE